MRYSLLRMLLQIDFRYGIINMVVGCIYYATS
nr:MAG TPA: hypothetical protein [Caudoviricetes sp.]